MKFFIHTLLLVFLINANYLFAQTTTVIYSENFNSSAGGWIIGGHNPSWKYGVPTLSNIISNGSNCFVTADAGASAIEPYASCPSVSGLTTTGNFYNCCELSYVESPSINLTGVASPQLSIDVNLFCEETFDGSKIQISTDGGVSWMDAGTYNGSGYLTFPHVENCREQNWYNKNHINYLGASAACPSVPSLSGSRAGWSGGCSQGGTGACSGSDNHGTNGWVTATQCIPFAANQPGVKIRVVFGAGSQVYADGIAFDNVTIYDQHPDVGFTTASASVCDYTVSFINTTDCGASWSWEFGDPGSAGNTSSDKNPDHTYSGAGTYTVTFIANDYCGGSTMLFQTVTVDTLTLPEINSIAVTDPLLCDSASGVISMQLGTTGTPPYDLNYSINNNQVSLSGLSGIPIVLNAMLPGNYSGFTITDAQGCSTESDTSFTMHFLTDGLLVDAFPDTTVLPGSPVTLSVYTNIPAVYSWSPAEGLSDPAASTVEVLPETTTTYSVMAVDTNGCEATAEVTVIVDDTRPCIQYYFPNTFTPNKDNKNENFGVIVSPLMDLDQFEMNIYDRWGRKVFNTNNPEKLWSGSDHPDGIYIVVAEFKCGNKKSSQYNGVLSLIR